MKIPESRGLRLLFEVSRRSIRKYLKHDDMPSYAAALAYRALFALFPFFTVLVALLAFIGNVGFFDWLIEQAYAALQEQYARLGEWLIEQIQYESNSELLVITIGIALWSVSSSVRTLTKALNAVHEVEESRPGWKRYPLSFFYALCLAIMVILAAALLLIGPQALEWVAGLVGLDEVFVSLWTRLRLPVALVLIMLSVSIIYWALPNVNHPYRLITPGAALAVFVWVIASLSFSFYLANFSNYSVIYGSLGVAFALLLYFYISAAVLLMGAELNAAIYYASDRNTQKKKKKKKKKSVGPAMKLRTPRPGAGQMSDAARVGPPYRPEPWVPWSEQCNVCFSSATFLQGRQAYTARAAAHVYSAPPYIASLLWY